MFCTCELISRNKWCCIFWLQIVSKGICLDVSAVLLEIRSEWVLFNEYFLPFFTLFESEPFHRPCKMCYHELQRNESSFWISFLSHQDNTSCHVGAIRWNQTMRWQGNFDLFFLFRVVAICVVWREIKKWSEQGNFYPF